ncbi:MAG: 30S ribosome-binding factor RbfA [Opitutaceae bacterium]|nr:30S ribosome-binding factor RbfA [Opitutaceae bacterium]
MSNRTLRINELVQREMSDFLRKKYQSESVTLTITAVEVASDLRTGKAFVGVIGDDAHCLDRLRWLRRHREEIRRELGKRVILKWNPRWEFVLDDSGDRGARILRALTEIEEHDRKASQQRGEGESGAGPA